MSSLTEMQYAVGIDLGTTFSCCAHYDSVTRSTMVFSGSSGARTIPSVVLAAPGGKGRKGQACLVLCHLVVRLSVPAPGMQTAHPHLGPHACHICATH
jgi:hypothetical protein